VGLRLGEGRIAFTALLFVSGFYCAPTITDTIDDLTRTVPARVRGEAMCTARRLPWAVPPGRPPSAG
jgi:hypothetical protein